MMWVWIGIGGGAGLGLGVALGFGVALAAMSLGPPRHDGTYGMREMLVCVPIGAVLGLAIGVVWAVRMRLAMH